MSKYKLMANAFISMSKVQRFKKLVCVYVYKFGKLKGWIVGYKPTRQEFSNMRTDCCLKSVGSRNNFLLGDLGFIKI